MKTRINTVGDLKAALAHYDDDLVIEHYGLCAGDGDERAVTLMHVIPDPEEMWHGSYEVLCFCGDTLITHKESEE